MRSRKKRNELVKTYGVLGLTKGAGATVYALALANYISAVRKKSVCLVEFLNEDDVDCLEESLDGRARSIGNCCGKDVNEFFVISTNKSETINYLIRYDFDVIILLCHSKTSFSSQFLTMCQKKYVVGSFSPWKRREFGMNYNAFLSNKIDIKALDFLSFGIDEGQRKEFFDVYRCQIRRIPFIENPLCLKYSNLSEIEILLD